MKLNVKIARFQQQISIALKTNFKFRSKNSMIKRINEFKFRNEILILLLKVYLNAIER